MQAFLIDRSWVKHWKEYVEYKKIKSGQIPSTLKKVQTPGPISNENLVRSTDGLLQIDDEMNYNLKEGLRENIDFKIFDEKMWTLFHSKYGGVEFKRYYRAASQYSCFT
jgi:hypothetical protein